MTTDNYLLISNTESEKQRGIDNYGADCDCDCDCDCGCDGDGGFMPVESPLKYLRLRVLEGAINNHQKRHQVSPTFYIQELSNDYYVASDPSNNQSIIVFNSNVKRLLDSFSTPKSISAVEKSEASILNRLVETRLLLTTSQASTFLPASKQTLVTWLHITDRCNLRCEYCYLPHVREDMSWKTGTIAVDTILKSVVQHGFQGARFKYAGGEPLIRADFLFDLHNYAMGKAKTLDVEIDGVVLSNGTLLNEEIIGKLKLSHLRLMISLDGLGQYHNTQRPYAGGQGSFDDVKKGILLALSHGIRPYISMTISGKNVQGIPKLVEWVLEKDLQFSLNFYRESDLSMSSESLQFEEKNIIQGMLEAYKVIEDNLPNRSLLASLVDRANLSSPHLKTCGVGENYLVFDQNGMVSKCQMAMKHPVSNMQTENLLAIINEDKSGIQNLSVEEKEGCKDCEWKYWCAGGCPLVTHRATGRYDVKSPNCKIYKAIYPKVVRLEGLRILKQLKN